MTINISTFLSIIDDTFSFLLVCNYTLTPPSYQFSSPDYNNPNLTSLYCEYHFKLPPNQTMQICYEVFSLHPSPSCTNDFVQLYERNILKATYCGFKSPFSWTSQESQVLMTFKSDAPSRSFGFFGFLSLSNCRKSSYYIIIIKYIIIEYSICLQACMKMPNLSSPYIIKIKFT